MGNFFSCLPQNHRAAAGHGSDTISRKETEVYELCGQLLDQLSERTESWKLLCNVTELVKQVKHRQLPIHESNRPREEHLTAFLKWASDHKITAKDVKPEVFPQFGGLGIMATDNIQAEMEVFRVPLTAMIDSVHATKRSDYLTKAANIDDAWVQVPIALDLFREVVKKEKSKFKEYIDVLPRFIQHPLLFQKCDFIHLQGSTAYGSSLGLFYEVISHYAGIYRKLYEDMIDCDPPSWETLNPRVFSLSTYLWAVTVALSRTLKVSDPNDRPVTVMVPYWDLCNNGTEDLYTIVSLVPKEGRPADYSSSSALVATAAKRILKGQEVQLTYRESTTPSEYLTVWGIVLIQYVPLSVEMPEAESSNDSEEEIEEKADSVSAVEIKILDAVKPITDEDIGLLYHKFKEVLSSDVKGDSFSRQSIWKSTLEFLISEIQKKLYLYAKDENSCQMLLKDSTLSGNSKLALRYSAAEQYVLRSAVKTLKKMAESPVPAESTIQCPPDKTQFSKSDQERSMVSRAVSTDTVDTTIRE